MQLLRYLGHWELDTVWQIETDSIHVHLRDSDGNVLGTFWIRDVGVSSGRNESRAARNKGTSWQ